MEVNEKSEQYLSRPEGDRIDNSHSVFKVPEALHALTPRELVNTNCVNDKISDLKQEENSEEISRDDHKVGLSHNSTNEQINDTTSYEVANDEFIQFAVPKNIETNQDKSSESKPNNVSSPSSRQKSLSIPYKEPPWGGLAPPTAENDASLYTLEELKNGVITGTHNLSKSFQVIGRLPTCDIQLEHPSLSRYHAILQFKATASSDKPAGFYLYDLDSTHGTFHNKNKCFPKTYYRLRVGHMMKFGGSTRHLILQGPEEDTEAESELSVTELKEIAAQKARKKQEEKLLNEKRENESELQGISWGMPEDAVEDEDENRSEEPKNISLVPENEHLYLNDPKKTLRGWFEREGYDLEYDCQELSYAKFKCTVTLPIEDENGTTTEVVAEATVSGKKKEAVVSCALEACRILDRRGLLRTSKHESRQKKSVKKWEDNDYYDSDEDEFLDRTGSLQAKRQKRMQSAKNSTLTENDIKDDKKDVPETFETLTEKHRNISNEINELQERIKKAKTSMEYLKNQNHKDEDEDLDSYMAAIENSADCSKVEMGKLTNQLFELKSTLRKLEKLIEIARPAKMPGFLSNLKTETMKTSNGEIVKKSSNIMVGKMFSRGIGKMKPINPNNKKVVIPNLNMPKGIDNILTQCDMPKKCDPLNKSKNEKDTEPNIFQDTKEKISGHLSKKTEKLLSDDNDEIRVATDLKKHTKPDKTKRLSETSKCKNSTNVCQNLGTSNKLKQNSYEEMSEQDERYTAWMPPKNQSGDGRTSLNDKYGY